MGDQTQDYIALARQLSNAGNFEKAFEVYILAFEDNFEIRSTHESDFQETMSGMMDFLRLANKKDEMLFNYSRALSFFPNNVFIINEMGNFFYCIGYYEKARQRFQDALRINENYVAAEKHLNSVNNLLVERWHYRMLNDKIRNKAYRRAIRDTLIPHRDTVLDLGTGTGLLSLYANECAPRIITACDGSKVMTEMARKITREYAVEHMDIFNKLSTDMQVPEIGGKRTLLITELFDAGLFGEQFILSLIHAWENLISDVGRVIPNKAEFFIIGAKCDFLNGRYQLCPSIKSILKIPTLNVHTLTSDASYDCEDVHLYGDDIKYMTEPQSLVQVDFNSCLELKKLIENNHYEVKLVAIESGEINTVIGFFNLYLTDNVTITTDPRSDQRADAWQQAIFFDKIPIHVQENDIIPMDFTLHGAILNMCREDDITRITTETIRFLNDTAYLDAIAGCLGTVCIYLGQIVDMSEVNILDLCPFPMFGLHLLKRGAKSLTCCANNLEDKRFFKKVFKANGIALSRVRIEVGDGWAYQGFGEEKYHVIFLHFFEYGGEIDVVLYGVAAHLRAQHLVQGGLFLPSNVKIMGQIVKSNWLDINNRLFDENVSNYRISKHINAFKVSQNFCIDFSHLDYTPLSDHIELDSVANPLGTGVKEVPIMKDGYSTAILCWFTIELMKDVKEISTKRKNCFMDGIVFMTDPEIRLIRGQTAQIIRCVDDVDGLFKYRMNAEET